VRPGNSTNRRQHFVLIFRLPEGRKMSEIRKLALKQETAKYVSQRDDLRYLENWDRLVEAIRKAGLPEK
jgi:hypothetical protein